MLWEWGGVGRGGAETERVRGPRSPVRGWGMQDLNHIGVLADEPGHKLGKVDLAAAVHVHECKRPLREWRPDHLEVVVKLAQADLIRVATNRGFGEVVDKVERSGVEEGAGGGTMPNGQSGCDAYLRPPFFHIRGTKQVFRGGEV